jgi:hypothetical protein
VQPVSRKSDPTLLRRHSPGKHPIVGPPMHPARFFGKRFEEIGIPTKAHSGLLCSADGAMARDLLLARISQAAARSARE